jgi:hypothetical protein
MVGGLHVQHIRQRPLVAHLLCKRARLIEHAHRRGIVAAGAERASQRREQAGLVRARRVTKWRHRSPADRHSVDQLAIPGELVHHGPSQPANVLRPPEPLIAVQGFVHCSQSVFPAAHAAQCHCQALQQLRTPELIICRHHRQRMLVVPTASLNAAASNARSPAIVR